METKLDGLTPTQAAVSLTMPDSTTLKGDPVTKALYDNIMGTLTYKKPKKVFVCDLCNVDCSGKIGMDTHLAGAKHKKKLRLTTPELSAFEKDDPVFERNKHDASLRCTICDVVANSAQSMGMHAVGKLHAANKRKLEFPNEPSQPKKKSGKFSKYNKRKWNKANAADGDDVMNVEADGNTVEEEKKLEELDFPLPECVEDLGQNRYWCSTCGADCQRVETLKKHLQSKKHVDKINRQLNPPSEFHKRLHFPKKRKMAPLSTEKWDKSFTQQDIQNIKKAKMETEIGAKSGNATVGYSSIPKGGIGPVKPELNNQSGTAVSGNPDIKPTKNHFGKKNNRKNNFSNFRNNFVAASTKTESSYWASGANNAGVQNAGGNNNFGYTNYGAGRNNNISNRRNNTSFSGFNNFGTAGNNSYGYSGNFAPGQNNTQSYSGSNSFATGGNNSFATGGNNSFVTGGNNSLAAGGNNSFATGGNGNYATGKNNSQGTAGNSFSNNSYAVGSNSYTSGGNNSYTSGGNNSYTSGENTGYTSGVNSGYTSGGSSGYTTGGNSGYTTGGNSGYTTGDNSGYTTSGTNSYAGDTTGFVLPTAPPPPPPPSETSGTYDAYSSKSETAFPPPETQTQGYSSYVSTASSATPAATDPSYQYYSYQTNIQAYGQTPQAYGQTEYSYQ